MNQARPKEALQLTQTSLCITLVLLSAFELSCTQTETSLNVESEVSQENAPSNKFVGSCDVRASLHFCYEYVGSAWTEQGAEDECASAPASAFSDSRCPPVEVVGACRYYPDEKQSLELMYYYYLPLDAATAQKSCPGTFVAAP